MATRRKTSSKKRPSTPTKFKVKKIPVRLHKPVRKRVSEKEASPSGSTATYQFGGKGLRLPLKPKRPDRMRVKRQRESGEPVSLDRRFRKVAYLKRMKRLLIKVGGLVKNPATGRYRIPLSRDKEVDDYACTHTFNIQGIGHDNKRHSITADSIVRVLSLEIEAAVNEKDYRTNMLVRAFTHSWRESLKVFKYDKIRGIHLSSISVSRLSLAEIKHKESRLKTSNRRKIRKIVHTNPREILGVLRLGKKYYPRGIRGGEVWIVETRSRDKVKYLAVVQRFYRKDGKKSTNRRNGAILWKPQKSKTRTSR